MYAAVTQTGHGLTSHEQQGTGLRAMIERTGSHSDAGSDVLLSDAAVEYIRQRSNNTGHGALASSSCGALARNSATAMAPTIASALRPRTQHCSGWLRYGGSLTSVGTPADNHGGRW